jgi:hypothetical protein
MCNAQYIYLARRPSQLAVALALARRPWKHWQWPGGAGGWGVELAAGSAGSWQLAVELAARRQSPTIAISGRWPMADGRWHPMADGRWRRWWWRGARYSVLPAVRGSWQRQPAVAVAGLPGPA